jgi:tetratricopeptide (TPR) repeat protein
MSDSSLFDLLLSIALVLLSFLSSMLLHELGHAIPILFMTREKVTIYIGSLGNPHNSFKISIGRLEIFCTFNPVVWLIGLCKTPVENLSINKKIVYTVAGPIASLLTALVCMHFLYSFELHKDTKFFLTTLFLLSSIITVFSIFPGGQGRYSFLGYPLQNDLYRLLQLLKYRDIPKDYWKALEFYKGKRYSETLEILEGLLQNGCSDVNIYRLAVVCHTIETNYQRADEINDGIKQTYGFNADDYCNASIILINKKKEEEAIINLGKALELNPSHLYSLNNIAYCLCLLNKPREAIEYVDKAILLAPGFAHAFATRGFAKIKSGDLEEGLKDVEHALALDNKNAYAYRNWGIYHLEKGELIAAQKYFEIAKELDAHTVLIDEYLSEVKRRQEGRILSENGI